MTSPLCSIVATHHAAGWKSREARKIRENEEAQTSYAVREARGVTPPYSSMLLTAVWLAAVAPYIAADLITLQQTISIATLSVLPG